MALRIDDEHALVMPDFLGNSYYNTLGNLLLNPRCGLLFLDFATGTTLQVAAEAEIVWDGPDVQRFAGAQRVVRFLDQKRNTLIYLAYSDKLVDGSPKNSISAVPIMPWPAQTAGK